MYATCDQFKVDVGGQYLCAKGRGREGVVGEAVENLCYCCCIALEVCVSLEVVMSRRWRRNDSRLVDDVVGDLADQ